MKTIDLVDKKGVKHEVSFPKAEAILRLGTNSMHPMFIPKESKYYFEDGVIKLKKKPRERKGSTKVNNELERQDTD